MNKADLKSKLPLALGLMGAGLLASGAPAGAVATEYVFVNSPGFSGSSLSGSFFFDSALSGVSAFSNLNILVQDTASITGPITFTTSDLIAGFTSTSGTARTNTTGAQGLVLTKAGFGSPTTESAILSLGFAQALTGNVPEFVAINTNSAGSGFSIVGTLNSGNVSPATFFSGGVPTPGVQAVPLETDALPVAGMTVVVGGMFWYRKRKRSQVSFNLPEMANAQDA